MFTFFTISHSWIHFTDFYKLFKRWIGENLRQIEIRRWQYMYIKLCSVGIPRRGCGVMCTIYIACKYTYIHPCFGIYIYVYIKNILQVRPFALISSQVLSINLISKSCCFTRDILKVTVYNEKHGEAVELATYWLCAKLSLINELLSNIIYSE